MELIPAFSLVLVDRELELEDFDLDGPPPAEVVVDFLDLEVDDFFDREGYSISHFSLPSPYSNTRLEEGYSSGLVRGKKEGKGKQTFFFSKLSSSSSLSLLPPGALYTPS